MKQSRNTTQSTDADKINIPKGEIHWVTYRSSNGKPKYLITSKPMRDTYFLYEVKEGGTIKKLGKSPSPAELEENYEVREKI